jgi:two-component system response regulator HydG
MSQPISTLITKFKLLNELSLQLQGLLSTEQFQPSVLNLLKSELNYDGIQYWSLPAGTSSSARLDALVGGPDGLVKLGQALSPRDSVLAYVFQKKESLVLETIPSEVKASSPLVSGNTRSLLAVPVVQPSEKRELLGILVVEASRESAFDSEDVLFFESLAAQMAVVSKNRELFVEAREASKKLESAMIEKDLELKRAQERLSRQQEDQQRQTKVQKTIADADGRGQEFIGESPITREILAMVDKVAPTLATVLILGESGTGKELIAKRIHQKSARANAPYVTVNCAALQEALLESELFGHERGSFTGAVGTKIGLCEAADGGTLFLDEIGEMSPAIQTKMLRFLQEGEFYRVGGKKPIRVNVRIVSATNRDLTEEVKTGRFREDLFYRLNTISMKMPALRERKEDIAALCEYFLKNSRYGGASSAKRIDPRVIEVFQNYSWPGNIRELQNTVERLKILSEGPTIVLEDVPYAIRMPKEASFSADLAIGAPLEDVEKGHILRTLAFNHGNKTKTAHTLGITIKTLYNKLHRYGAIAPDAAAESQTQTTN